MKAQSPLISLTLALIYAALLIGTYAAAAADNERVIVAFDGPAISDTVVRNNVDVELLNSGPQRGLRVKYHVVDWPNVYFRPTSGTWDWTGFSGIAFDVYNPESAALNVAMRVDNAGADGVSNCNQLETSAKSGSWTTLRLRFNRAADKTIWGMRGLPVTGPTGGGPVLDLSKIVAFQVFLAKPKSEHTLILNNFRLFGGGSNMSERVIYPFVDRFGQYRNATWPGKLTSEADLRTRAISEAAGFKASPQMPGRDRFGGWSDGPKLKATGWFRAEKVDGRWWLVTPDGSLFFSNGIDCIAPGEYTFIDKRDKWFEWLPTSDDGSFQFVTEVHGAHSNAEPVGGQGRAFSFYESNLLRKYGPEWRSKWMDVSAARMRSWGFNTAGNWSDEEYAAKEKVPYVASGGIEGNVRRIEGGGGYWGKMVDAYDPGFPAAVDAALSGAAARHASDPYCIGYFSDNEIAWEAVERGTLASPPDQPCRIVQVEMLQKEYGNSLDRLNAAWGTTAASWDALHVPDKPNVACQSDLDTFVYAFAKRYFQVCKDAYHKAAPNQMYLGCRFASAPKPAVRACADVADVVSFNIYSSGVSNGDWTGTNDLGKPLLIGEFHFGALDRGMFHEGSPRANQAERALAYLTYVRSVADCPNFVGCHWFQYIDEPLTGRWYDGENYNIGLVDVTDTPYPELIAAAKQAHSEVYTRHASSK